METPINQFTFTKDELSSMDENTVNNVIVHLEEGHVVYLSNMAFLLNENESQFLSPDIIDNNAKNISYHPATKQLGGCSKLSDVNSLAMQQFMHRYCDYAKELIRCLLPAYYNHIETGRTSYRPVEIKGRPSSYRKDDTRLHVDAFPSMPVQGRRILRVFCNVNPENTARVWNLGEPFTNVAKRFLPTIPKHRQFTAKAMKALSITKSERSPYDHYMLKMHHAMKKDQHYQNVVNKTEMRFLPGTTWLVFTDQASHAALTGQYLLEQTFYLPVSAMVNEDKAPLRMLESMLQRPLI